MLNGVKISRIYQKIAEVSFNEITARICVISYSRLNNMNLISKQSQYPWIIRQRWTNIIFLHFRVESSKLPKFIPFPLDKYNNQTFVSIVPFKMSHIDVKNIPRFLTMTQTLWELNLRTYVNVDGVKGIYFLTLDATNILGNIIANSIFHLPYRLAFIDHRFNHLKHYHHNDSYFELNYKREGITKAKTEFDLWATERYSLFTKKHKNSYQGNVRHKPWDLERLEILKMEDGFSSMIGERFEMSDIQSPSYCQRLDVSFEPFIKI